ncbi:MAG: type I phosphomannose isomerase catalytic subunit [Bacilli bacterium]|jgi:mannose-6-phosphate isomerase class I
MKKTKPFIPVLKLQPVFVERIWGGSWLKEEFSYPITSDKIGECWVISAHPSANCIVLNSPYKGSKLSDVYYDRRDLFAFDRRDKFPLLVKFIDAKEDLSVQVHPDDEYALKHEGQSGKSEAWIILNAKPDTRILVGHKAKSHQELKDMVYSGRWGDLLKYRPLASGEIINIPSGTVHALCAGTALIEIQQSSDVTYRLYDYNRIDKNGSKRELHLQKSIDVIQVPSEDSPVRTMPKKHGHNRLVRILETPHFEVQSLIVDHNYKFVNHDHKYYLVAIIKGRGKIGSLKAKKGDSFILTSPASNLTFQGNMRLIVVSN